MNRRYIIAPWVAKGFAIRLFFRRLAKPIFDGGPKLIPFRPFPVGE